MNISKLCKAFMLSNAVLLMTSCSMQTNNSHNNIENCYSDATLVTLSSIESDADTALINNTIVHTTTTTSIYNETTETNEVEDEVFWWSAVLDIADADEIIEYGTSANAYWYNSTLMRYSSGAIFCCDNYEEFASFDMNVDATNSEDLIRLNVGDVINGLTVSQAQFSLNHMERFNRASVTYSGDIALTGLLRIYQEDDEFGISKCGDVFFYPYPETFNQYPLVFPQSYPVMLYDSEDSFYFFADTARLYLGNIESLQMLTRLETMPSIEIELVQWTMNTELADMLARSIDETEYYEAELRISDLFLLQYDDIMTGSPFSVAKVNQVISLNEKMFEMID